MTKPVLFLVCDRCGIPFTMPKNVLEKRLLRESLTPKACMDCYQRPPKIDLKVIWDLYLSEKDVAT